MSTCTELMFDPTSESGVTHDATAEVECTFCQKPLCRDHAHICSDKEVACYDCLAGLGAVE